MKHKRHPSGNAGRAAWATSRTCAKLPARLARVDVERKPPIRRRLQSEGRRVQLIRTNRRKQGSEAMIGEIIRNLSWVGLGIGLVLLVTVLELLLRGLVTRYGTPQG
jgi:hypothetical protein